MKQKTGRRLLGVLLALALVVGLMPGMGLTAYADNAETLLTTITATAKEQASYSTENVATVSFSYSSQGSSSYLANWGWWGYGWTATVAPAEGYTITKCIFYDDKDRTATDSEAPFVVETTEEDKTPKVNGTHILADQSKGIKKIEVYGYATPTVAEDTTYTLTIPSTLTVANAGWNATDGISATGSLATGKKLTVTASSTNSWALKSGENSVGYTLTTAEGGSQTISWEFTTLDGTAKPMGIIVEDYSAKPAGTYTDTVTFTASVEDKTVTFTVKRVGKDVGPGYPDGNYTVAAGTTWQQFIDSGDAPACLSIGTGYNSGKVLHDLDSSVEDCGGTSIANVADKKHVKPGDAIIDGATYGCSDYLGYQDHD